MKRGNGGRIGSKNVSKSGIWLPDDVALDTNSIRTRDITTGLVNRWRLNENTNAIVGASHLTNNGTVTFSADGASFNGSNQWLSCVGVWPAAFTISFWCKYIIEGQLTPFGILSSGNSLFTAFTVASDVNLYCNTNQHIYSGKSCADNAWHLFAATGVSANSGSWSFFLDGVACGTATFTQYGGSVLPNAFSIGRLGAYDGWYFAGNVLDARIYGRTLLSDEMVFLYRNGPNPT